MMQTHRTAAEKLNGSRRNHDFPSAKLNSSWHESEAAAWTGAHFPIESNSAETGGPEGDSPRFSVQQLQRTIGNQGVQRLLQRYAMASSNNDVAVLGQPQQPTTQPQGQQVGNPPATQPQSGQLQRYTAFFSIAQSSSRAHAVCNIPETPGCVAKWSKWQLYDASGALVMTPVTVSEQFTKKSGPDDVFNKLKPQSNTTDKGFFDDCYGLCVPDGTPPFVLEVQQNHIVNSQIASQNFITYSPSGISLRVCRRTAQGFGPPCQRF
jgi:hypothetical protein